MTKPIDDRLAHRPKIPFSQKAIQETVPGYPPDEMTTGPELDALVATKVMGWTASPEGLWLDAKGFWTGWVIPESKADALSDYDSQWTPSTHIAAAWQVLEKLREDRAHIAFHMGGPNGDFRPCVHICPLAPINGRSTFSEEADTTPLAICLAALKASGVTP